MESVHRTADLSSSEGILQNCGPKQFYGHFSVKIISLGQIKWNVLFLEMVQMECVCLGVAVIFSLFTHTRPETPHTRHDFYTEAKHYKHFAQTKSYVPSYDVSWTCVINKFKWLLNIRSFYSQSLCLLIFLQYCQICNNLFVTNTSCLAHLYSCRLVLLFILVQVL